MESIQQEFNGILVMGGTMITYEAIPALVIVGFLSILMLNLALWALIELETALEKQRSLI